jgi:hypothetical protein
MPAAHVWAAERRVVRRLKEAGASNPHTASPLPDLPLLQRTRLRHLLKHHIVLEVGPGRFYLDEPAWDDHVSRQRRLGFAIVFVFFVILVILLAASRH